MAELNLSPPKGTKVRVRTLKTDKDLKKLMSLYFLKAQFYSKVPWKHTAWGTSSIPIELLWGMNIFPLHPENSATVSGARKRSLSLIEHSESLGYSRDLCSYFKTNIGACDKKIGVNFGGITKPDFCVTSSAICDTHTKWFQIQARKMNVPYFIFDIPHEVSGTDEKTRERYINYIVQQLWDYFDFVHDLTGIRYNKKRFDKVTKKSDRLCELWQEIYKYRANIPSPLGLNDTFGQIFPLVLLPGIDDGIHYYEKLLAEVKQLNEEKKGIIPDEKYRLLFEGIPFWYKIKFIYDIASMGASIVYEPYTWAFGPRKKVGLSTEDTLRETAKMWLQQPYYYNLDNRIKYFKQVIKEYHIDGVVLHNNMSCRPNSTGLIDLKNSIQKESGIPAIILNSDMNDPRQYSEAPILNRMESFIEIVHANKFGQ